MALDVKVVKVAQLVAMLVVTIEALSRGQRGQRVQILLSRILPRCGWSPNDHKVRCQWHAKNYPSVSEIYLCVHFNDFELSVPKSETYFNLGVIYAHINLLQLFLVGMSSVGRARFVFQR